MIVLANMGPALVVPSFIAGVITFLAPCTLPLLPAYLGFISGVPLGDLRDPAKARKARAKIFVNGLFYVVGFSAVFILLGVLFGVGGAALARYHQWLARIGGAFIVLFGLFMMGAVRLPFLSFLGGERLIAAGRFLKPGHPASSFALGAAFAVGWTPCVGPVLGSVLLLASASATALEGALLLAVFSLGLAIPFLAIALGIGWASRYLVKVSAYLRFVSVIGGAFLVFLGVLLLTGNLDVWVAYAYRLLDFLDYDRLLDYL